MTSSIIKIVISACHYDNETQNESIQLRCCYGHHHFQQYFLKVDNDGTAFTPSMGARWTKESNTESNEVKQQISSSWCMMDTKLTSPFLNSMMLDLTDLVACAACPCSALSLLRARWYINVRGSLRDVKIV